MTPTLESIANHPLGLRDHIWAFRIEMLRRRLLRSKDTVDIEDFGSGTHAEANAGVTVKSGRTVTRTITETCASASKGKEWNLLMMRIIRATRPTRGIELGTCLGLSAAYQAAAMRLNGQGEMLTLEGAPALARLAKGNLIDLGLSNNAEVIQGRFQDTLPALLKRAPVDYAFVDGHHDEHATWDYHDMIASAAKPGTVVVYDDIDWNPGMRAAWQKITADTRVVDVLDRGKVGAVRLQ